MARPERQALANGFSQIMCDSIGEPGNYVVIENTPCYFLSENRLLLPPSLAHDFDSVVESIQGTPWIAPSDVFTVLATDKLAAALFYFKKYRRQFQGIACIGVESVFPFFPCPSRIFLPKAPLGVIGAIPLLEDWGIAHRLASFEPQPGCFLGSAEALSAYF